MAGTTPIYGLPYPQPSDLVANYPALGQDLAEDIETVLLTKGDVNTNTTYVSYLPVISFAGGSGWTVTTSTIGGGFMQIGKQITFYCYFTVSAFTVGSTGNLCVSLPAPMRSTGVEYRNSLYCQLKDASTGATFGGPVTTISNATDIMPCYRVTGQNQAGYSFYNGSPIVSAITVANGDTFIVSGTYERS